MARDEETPIVHAHARSGDPSAFIFDHVTKLQYLSDKVKEHDNELTNNKTIITSMTKSLSDINDNIKAVKWAVIGCAIMLVVNQFGLISTIKIWLFR